MDKFEVLKQIYDTTENKDEFLGQFDEAIRAQVKECLDKGDAGLYEQLSNPTSLSEGTPAAMDTPVIPELPSEENTCVEEVTLPEGDVVDEALQDVVQMDTDIHSATGEVIEALPEAIQEGAEIWKDASQDMSREIIRRTYARLKGTDFSEADVLIQGCDVAKDLVNEGWGKTSLSKAIEEIDGHMANSALDSLYVVRDELKGLKESVEEVVDYISEEDNLGLTPSAKAKLVDIILDDGIFTDDSDHDVREDVKEVVGSSGDYSAMDASAKEKLLNDFYGYEFSMECANPLTVEALSNAGNYYDALQATEEAINFLQGSEDSCPVDNCGSMDASDPDFASDKVELAKIEADLKDKQGERNYNYEMEKLKKADSKGNKGGLLSSIFGKGSKSEAQIQADLKKAQARETTKQVMYETEDPKSKKLRLRLEGREAKIKAKTQAELKKVKEANRAEEAKKREETINTAIDKLSGVANNYVAQSQYKNMYNNIVKHPYMMGANVSYAPQPKSGSAGKLALAALGLAGAGLGTYAAIKAKGKKDFDEGSDTVIADQILMSDETVESLSAKYASLPTIESKTQMEQDMVEAGLPQEYIDAITGRASGEFSEEEIPVDPQAVKDVVEEFGPSEIAGPDETVTTDEFDGILPPGEVMEEGVSLEERITPEDLEGEDEVVDDSFESII